MKKVYRNLFCLLFLLSFVFAGVSFNASAADSELGRVFGVYPVNTPYGIKVTWRAVDEAEGYKLYRRCGENGEQEFIARLDAVDELEYFDGTVISGKRYFYSLKAIKGSVEGAMSDEKSRTFIASPEIIEAESKKGYVKLSWSKVGGADEYLIYRKAGAGEWQKIDSVGKGTLVYNDKKIKNNTLYGYAIVTRDGNGLSTMDESACAIRYMATPGNFNIKNTDNKIKFSWGKISGAVKYRVYRKATNEKSWTRVATVSTNAYVDKGIKNGKQYYYTVRALGNNGGISAYTTSSKYTAMLMPTGVIITSKPSAVRISWNKHPYATEYRVYRNENGSWKRISVIKNNNTTFFDDKAVKNGVTYKYTVLACYKGHLGSYNRTGYEGVHYFAPKLSLQYSPKGIKLIWNKAIVGSSYTVYYKAEGQAKWKAIAKLNDMNTKTITYIHKTPAYGKSNTYFIRVNGADIRTDSYTKKLYGIDPNKKIIAFTYDDGPSTEVTNKILKTLDKYDARATFFVVGNRVGSNKTALKKAVNMGCEIGNHSYSHATLTKLSTAQIQSQINKTNSAIKSATGVAPTLVRAPGGSVNGTVRKAVKYPIISWSVDTLDWKSRNAKSVVKEIKSSVKDGSIVLMHDLYGSTATATEQIIPWLIDNGYQIVTVTELMQIKGVNMKAGTVYYSANNYR